MTIAIVGAGIGGLTTALLLEEFGINVQVFEQANEIKPVGAGIILAHNAMQVFDKLGFNESLTKLGSPLTSTNLTTEKLRIINRIETKYFDDKYCVNGIAIQRGVLQEFLMGQLKTNCIHLDKQVVEVKICDRPSLIFSDNEEFECDAIIAADGINSIVRNTLFEDNTIRKPNQRCWRGISNIKLPLKFQRELNELWGKGSRFGFVNLSNDSVYWYGLHSSHENIEKQDLLDCFRSYDPIVNEIILQTDFEKVFKSDICDLKPITTWYKHTVCLLGDAAHATTPNIGQGACQAIEDAYVLSHCINKYPINIAFSKYEGLRKTKADMIVALSWQLGVISQLESSVLSSFRNFAMKAIPAKYNLKQLDKIYNLAKV